MAGVGTGWFLRSLPTQAILWFCDSKLHTSSYEQQKSQSPLLDALILSPLLINIPSGPATVHSYYLLYPSCHTSDNSFTLLRDLLWTGKGVCSNSQLNYKLSLFNSSSSCYNNPNPLPSKQLKKEGIATFFPSENVGSVEFGILHFIFLYHKGERWDTA